MNFEGGVVLKPNTYLLVGGNDLVVARQKSARGYDRKLLSVGVSAPALPDGKKRDVLNLRSLLHTRGVLGSETAGIETFSGTQAFWCPRMSSYRVCVEFLHLREEIVTLSTNWLWETFGDVTVNRFRHYGSVRYSLSAEMTVDVFSRQAVAETLSPPRADFELRRAKSRARLNDERAHNWLTPEWLMKIVGEFGVDLLPLVDEKSLVRFLTKEHQYAPLFPGLCGDLSDAAGVF